MRWFRHLWRGLRSRPTAGPTGHWERVRGRLLGAVVYMDWVQVRVCSACRDCYCAGALIECSETPPPARGEADGEV